VNTLDRERGVALIISLIVMAVLTVLGITALSGTRLNERAASNAQQKSIAFDAAESAIAFGWSIDNMMASIDSRSPSAYNYPAPVSPVGAEALSTVLDQRADSSGPLTVDVSSTVTIQYCGESTRPARTGLSADETDMNMSGLQFDVLGSASIEGSLARASHVQRGMMVRPSTGRTGNCSAPAA